MRERERELVKALIIEDGGGLSSWGIFYGKLRVHSFSKFYRKLNPLPLRQRTLVRVREGAYGNTYQETEINMLHYIVLI